MGKVGFHSQSLRLERHPLSAANGDIALDVYMYLARMRNGLPKAIITIDTFVSPTVSLIRMERQRN